ncbi:MAG: hypothetical protein DWH94_09210 [Planctomycetota bacterium]|nr:MAG: hypothetical protein DWH94_09210 [Planctomycetota bacterium]
MGKIGWKDVWMHNRIVTIRATASIAFVIKVSWLTELPFAAILYGQEAGNRGLFSGMSSPSPQGLNRSRKCASQLTIWVRDVKSV